MSDVNNQFLVGEAADAAMNDEGGGKNRSSFSSLKSGTTYQVKVVGLKDYFQFFSYGIYQQIDSFCADKPSKKTAKGFPIDNLTPWDKAFRYYKDLSQDWTDEYSQKAGQFKPKPRFAMAFFDLTSGEVIAVDVSAKQHAAVKATIEKYAKKIDKYAFELAKTGEGTGTSVSFTPVIDMDEDLDEKQRENFKKAPAEIDMTKFFTAPYIADENEQLELLQRAGFDLSLIGASLNENAPADNDGLADEELPF